MVAIERWPTLSGITQSIREGITQSVNDFQYVVVVVICWEENISPIKKSHPRRSNENISCRNTRIRSGLRYFRVEARDSSQTQLLAQRLLERRNIPLCAELRPSDRKDPSLHIHTQRRTSQERRRR